MLSLSTIDLSQSSVYPSEKRPTEERRHFAAIDILNVNAPGKVRDMKKLLDIQYHFAS